MNAQSTSEIDTRLIPPLTQRATLLLKATLLEGEPARAAWDEWRARTVLEKLSHAETRLLPLLYRNLGKLDVEESHIPSKLRGVYRHCWIKNQTLFHGVAPILRVLDEAGIDLMVIKGAAMITAYYKDFGVRPMYDFDILVPEKKAQAALDVLSELGWQCRRPDPKSLVGVGNAVEFTSSLGFRFDLHWRLMLECCHAGNDDSFWKDTGSIDIEELPVRTLNPTDQLLHTCVYGPCASYESPLKWIADVWTLLDKAGDRVDWDDLARKAGKRELAVPVREALALVSQLGMAVPAELTKMTAPTDQEHAFAAMIQRQRWMGQLSLWQACPRRLVENATVQISFREYLQRMLGVEKAWKLPIAMVGAAGSGLRRRTRDE